MIPEKPQIITSPICYNGDKRAIPESTPLGSNQLSFESGFPVLTSTPLNAGGLPPDRLDFNAALNLLSTFIYYMQSGNQFVWDALLDYNKGATVLGSDGALYFCIQANGATSPNTVQNPTNSTGYWVKVIDAQGVFNINIIADGAVSTEKLANGAVTSAKIADGTIVNADIANTTITGAKLVNKTITAKQIADNTITATQLAANSVGASELADNAVDTNAIANLSVTNAKIANAAVNDAKISGVSASKVSGLATVAKTGSYNDLLNKPTISTNVAPRPNTNNYNIGCWLVISSSSQGVYIIPSGGTWVYFIFPVNVNGDVPIGTFPARSDVVSGGTNLKINNNYICGFCWRIQ